MSPSRTNAPIAFIYASDGVTEPVREALAKDGYQVTLGFAGQFTSSTQFATFVEIYNPKVIVYELLPPHERTLSYVLTLKALKAAEGREFVLTTTDRTLIDAVSRGSHVVETIGRGGELTELRRAVHEALARARAIEEEPAGKAA
jgi:hypothetical protein